MNNIIFTSNDDDEATLPYSDMMTSLMLVFLLIAISLMAIANTAQKEAEKDKAAAEAANKEFVNKERIARTAQKEAEIDKKNAYKEKNIVKRITEAWEKGKHQIYKHLHEKFSSYLESWHAEIIPNELVVRFSVGSSGEQKALVTQHDWKASSEFNKVNVQFEQASSSIDDEFKNILKKFCPEYISILLNHRNYISEIRIEGHTSSEWGPETSPLEAYYKNMELSQNRTRAVLKYCFDQLSSSADLEWAKSNFVAVGLSSSKLLKTHDREDKEKSRRVEFRVITTTEKEIENIAKEFHK